MEGIVIILIIAACLFALLGSTNSKVESVSRQAERMADTLDEVVQELQTMSRMLAVRPIGSAKEIPKERKEQAELEAPVQELVAEEPAEAEPVTVPEATIPAAVPTAGSNMAQPTAVPTAVPAVRRDPKCANCGYSMMASAVKACPYCGTVMPLQAAVCPQCAAAVEPGVNCPSCGGWIS